MLLGTAQMNARVSVITRSSRVLQTTPAFHIGGSGCDHTFCCFTGSHASRDPAAISRGKAFTRVKSRPVFHLPGS